MSGLELNKIIASILLAALIAMMVGFIANVIYKPTIILAKRGYQVEVLAEESNDTEEVQLDIPALMASANIKSGAKTIKKCLSCHSFNKGGANKVGPNLWKIAGGLKGKKDGFSYSKVMTAAEGTWNDEDLFFFLAKPSKFMPGTKMSFVGLRKPQDVANVITYLKEKAG